MMSLTVAARFAVLAFSCSVGLAACGHGESATKPAAPPRAQPTPQKSEPRQEVAEQPEERIEDYMVDHFVIITFARDAVINGDLEALREPLRVLAAHDYKGVVPGGWMPWVAELQEAAGLTAGATTLEAAAVGVATMARTCASCHEANAAPLELESSGRERATPSSDTLGARMRRHQWAADRMWEGLTGPSEEIWQDGASALAHTPASPPITEPPLPPPFVNALLATRALADDALAASTSEQRADVYGLLLASCSGCHTYGVEFEF